MKQGTRANFTGSNLQGFVQHILKQRGYQEVDRKAFAAARELDQAVFSSQYPIGNSIYGTKLQCDFILYHPVKHPKCLIIECKWQESAGSVDEKFPYLVANIKECYPHATIIILDGGGYKPSANMWLRHQVDAKLLHVMNMAEFQRWSNGDEL